MKTKSYSGSTSLGIYAATTKASAAKYSTLPDQLWVFFMGVRSPYLFFPTLPPSERYFSGLWVIVKVRYFEKTYCC
jgi:hypothetical protein